MINSGSLTIKTFCKKNLLTLKFEDSGIGIPKKNLTKIFDPFFTTKKKLLNAGYGSGADHLL